MIVLAHLSDTHFTGAEPAAERASRVWDYLRDLPGSIDAVLVTGDIADHGRPAEYEEASAEFSFPGGPPVLTCPGNHDDRAAFRRGLLGADEGATDAPDAPINRVWRVAGATIAMCDTTIPGEGGGRLADATLEWLDAALADGPADAPAFVCFHHPPVALHIPYVDAIRQTDERRLADVLARHPRVVALLCGHAHTAAATTFAGLPLLVAPGVSSTLRLPWEHTPVVTDTLPPAVAFHVLDDDRRLTTHYRALP